jgi:acyl dehydratase
MAFSESHLYYDDVQIGQQWTSPARTVTQTDVVNFAGISGDYNAIHMDHEYARNTPFRQPIAHGLLVLSIGSGLSLHYPAMRTMAFLLMKEWYFREPVFFGDTIHAVTKVLEIEERSRGKRAVITWARCILNQDGKIVQEGVTQTLVEGRAMLARNKTEEPRPSPSGQVLQSPMS